MGAISLSKYGTSEFLSVTQPIFKKPKVKVPERQGCVFHNSVGHLLKMAGDYPKTQLLLGSCPDRHPIFIDLLQPDTAPALIIGASGSGKTHQLQVLAESALLNEMNNPMELWIFSPIPEEWEDVANKAKQRDVVFRSTHWFDQECGNLIDQLVSLAETREEQAHDILVILDGLQGLLQLDWEGQLNFRWLLEYGSQVHIWLVASINPSQIDQLNFWTDCFKINIYGWMGNVKANRKIKPSPATQEGEFSIQIGDHSLVYMLPMLGV